ncbi:MAG: LVIVD repeat-containing protein [Gemmatimonadota bacterium]
MKRTIPICVLATVTACGGGPSGPGPDPDPGSGSVAIAWQGGTVDWGAPAPLTVTVEGGSVDDVVWRSLNDVYRNLPAILGRGSSITTAALRPGTTRVEAVLLADDVAIARDTVQVSVRYRESWNLELLAHVPYPGGTVGDVWVDGGRAHVARRSAGGISIVALDGGVAEVGRFAPEGQFTQDVKVADGIAYVSHEPVHGFEAYPFSVTMVDVSDPANPVVVGGVPTDIAPSAHNLWLDGDLLTVAAAGTDFSLFDVADPADPRFLSRIEPDPATAHDAHVRGGFLFGSSMGFNGNRGRLTVASLADPESPSVLGVVAFDPQAFTHSSWLSSDSRYLYVAEENVNAPIRIFDVSTPGTPRFVGAYQPRLGTVPHNFQVSDGRFAYLSHYKHGIEVVDVSDPERPRLVGFYDTHPGADEEPTGLAPAHDKEQDSFQGAWGVHWSDDGRIVASDMNRGLFVFRFTGSQD